LFYVLYESGQSVDELFNLKIRLGICALLGHVFPIYVGFKGGKGVATLLGIILALNHEAALMSIGVFLIVFLLTGYVSLASITAGLFFPVVVMVISKTSQPAMVVFALMISVAVIITHQKNIERLLNKKENRVNLFNRKAKENTDIS
jgi:glycerol-3-phosphate acyltransferase PlsY